MVPSSFPVRTRAPARWLVALLVAAMMVAALLANFWGAHERRVGAPSLISGQPGFAATVLADPSGTLTLEQVTARADAFVPLAARTGFSPHMWYRLAIDNPSGETRHSILTLSSDYILAATLYQLRGDGPPVVERSGGTVGWFRRPVAAAKVAFSADLPPRRTTVLYVRVDDAIKQPKAFLLWNDRAAFSHLTELYKLEYTGYLSLWFGLFIYNGILYAVLRRKDYLLYLVYMLCLAALLATASDISTLLAPWPAWPLRGLVGMVLLNLTVFSLLQFSRAFLETPEREPALDRWLRRLGWLVLGTSVAGFGILLPGTAAPATAVVFVVNSIALAALPLVGLALAFRRTPQAGIYVLAFLPLIATLVFILLDTHGLPDGHNSSLLLLSGSALELVFLAIALAWRYRVIVDERDRLRDEYTSLLEAEVQQRTRELRESNESLAQANRDKDRVFSILGHDLRGPAQQLSSLSRLMVDAPEVMPAAEAAALAREIEEGCQAQLELLDTLVLWGRAQPAGAADAAEATPVGTLANAAVAALRVTAARKGIDLAIEIRDDLAVRARPQAAQAVLRNLIGNAVKFSHHGARIVLAARAAGDKAHLVVRDTGIGMGPDRLQEILAGPVRSQAGTRKEMGSGIGLTICRDLARADGGDLTIDSEPGAGTTATLILPLAYVNSVGKTAAVTDSVPA